MARSAELDGRHAVVTGGGTGIGAAIAAKLSAMGATVTIMGRREKTLQQAARDLGVNYGVVDVTDADSVEQGFAQCAQQHGPVAILINNAGAVTTAPFSRTTQAQWRDTLAVNLDGVFNCTQQVLRSMMKQGYGRVINVASTAGLLGYRYVSAYCAAKHGVIGLTRALALETARSGVTVNALCPGYTDTNIVSDAVKTISAATGRGEDDALSSLTDSNPQGRLVQPAEVAAAAAWLCGPDSDAMTGQSIAVAGGEVM